MMTLKILLAEANQDEAAALQTAIGVKLDQHIDGVEVTVQIVTTLADVHRFAASVNVILIDLHLADAGPEEVIAAIPDLPQPVIVITDIIDPAVHARVIGVEAVLVIKSQTRSNEIYRTILHCMGKSVARAARYLPA